MIDHATALYCIVDDLLKAVGHQDDPRRALTDAEVLTTALMAAHCFGGNVEHARRFHARDQLDASDAFALALESPAARCG